MAFDGLRSEADLWLGADDTADVLAGKAGEANERLRLAAATVEQEVLVCAAALCGKPSLPPSALEFELSSHLATLQVFLFPPAMLECGEGPQTIAGSSAASGLIIPSPDVEHSPEVRSVRHPWSDGA